MAKLTKEQWAGARAKWEDDKREGFDWLASELGGVVSRQAIQKQAEKNGWSKGGKKAAQPKKSCATKEKKLRKPLAKVAQPTPLTQVAEDAEWEAVEDERRPNGRPSVYLEEFAETAFNSLTGKPLV